MKKCITYIGSVVLFCASFFLLPSYSIAQTNNQIQSINWTLTAPSPFSLSGGGTLIVDGSSWQELFFKWQIEWGFGENYSSGPGGYLIPDNATPSTLFTSTPAHLAHVPGTNQYVFNIPTGFQNSMWPATKYYFDILEWNNSGTIGTKKFMFGFIETPALNPSSVSLDVNQGSNSAYEIQLSVNGPQGVLLGMPVGIYFLTSPLGNQPLDPNGSGVVWAGTSTFGNQNSLTVNIPAGVLTPGTNYYLQLVNDQPGAGGLSLLGQEVTINIPVPDPNTGGGNTSGGSAGTNTGNGGITTDEDFSNGLITCDGIEVPCTFEKLLEMVNKAITFFIFVIAVPIIALVFVYAGFLLITSGGNPSKKDDAKEIITKAVWGLVITLGAWLIVKTILVVLGYQGPLLGILGVD